MVAVSNDSHVKIVANLAILLTRIESLGENYCPPIQDLALDSLQKRLETAKKNMRRVRTAHQAYGLAFEARRVAYIELCGFKEQLLASFRASVNDISEMARVYSLFQKISMNVLRAADTSQEAVRVQKEYDAINEYFQQLIIVLENNSRYKAQVPEIDVAGLRQLYINLWDKNNAVKLSEIAFSTAKGIRDEFLYNPVTGILETINNVKEYIESDERLFAAM